MTNVAMTMDYVRIHQGTLASRTSASVVAPSTALFHFDMVYADWQPDWSRFAHFESNTALSRSSVDGHVESVSFEDDALQNPNPFGERPWNGVQFADFNTFVTNGWKPY